MNDEELIMLAIEARKKSITPTNYYVGAALQTVSGKIYTGCNLGSTNGLFNICAERVAIVKMLSEGKEKINKIAVVGGTDDKLILTTPCGICRQLIFDLGKDISVITAYYEGKELKYKVQPSSKLLPLGYEM